MRYLRKTHKILRQLFHIASAGFDTLLLIIFLQNGKIKFLNGSNVEWTHWTEGNPISDSDLESMTLQVHQRTRRYEDGFANVKPITYRYRPLCQRYLL